ncbi:hypothetical protein IDM30_21025 [Acinetobacter seifertii]|nr:hypothetical protein [Acinetobacter seifertii]
MQLNQPIQLLPTLAYVRSPVSGLALRLRYDAPGHLFPPHATHIFLKKGARSR